MVNTRFDTAPSIPGGVTAALLKDVFKDSYDFASRELFIGGDTKKPAALCFIDGLVSGQDISEFVVRPAADPSRFPEGCGLKEAVDAILTGAVCNFTVNKRLKMEDAVGDLLSGFCCLVLDELGCALTFETRSSERRSVGEPEEEKVVKGAKDAFVETLKINTGLIRRKIRDETLKFREFTVGTKTRTTVVLAYLEGFTDGALVAKASERISAIRADGVLTSAVIEDNLADSPATPFPQILSTERTDKFCMNLLEGRVGVLADGLPFGYLAPGTFSQFMKVPEDHANHFLVASSLTLLRYASMLITLLLPGFYVAIAMYHREMIPIRLMQSMIDAKQSVPFPTAIEVLMLLIAFELLQEAGLRLPDPIGQTVSIIGALIVGQSAVEAKIVSPVVVVVIALAGIAGYTMPNQDMGAALRVARFILVILAILLGMFGLATGFALLLHHLAGLESFGVPYMTPFAGNDGRLLSRALLRRSLKNASDADATLNGGAE